jgi:3D (Asp-Asp-Asp) domain-containing protein
MKPRLAWLRAYPWNVLACLAVIAAGSIAYVSAFRTVVVDADGQSVRYRTLRGSVAEVLAERGVAVGARDVVEPDASSRVVTGLRIVVHRAVPATLVVDGRVAPVHTIQKTAGAMVRALGVAVGRKDRILPSEDTPVVPGMRVRVVRVKEMHETVSTAIPFETVRRNDASVFRFNVVVGSQGAPGLVREVFRVVYHDGVEASRTRLSRTVVREATPRVLLVGTRRMLAARGHRFEGREYFQVEATAYAPNHGQGVNDITATGMRAQRGVIAVDPQLIPLGTRVYVEGYGHAIAADTGGAIRGRRIDVCMNTPVEAYQWGRRGVKIYLLRD